MLDAEKGRGGPVALAGAKFFPGINDPLGDNPTGAAFDSKAFTLYAPWLNVHNSGRWAKTRKGVARGEVVFDTHPLSITGVTGLNDALGLQSINGTCTTCHDTRTSATTRVRCRSISGPVTRRRTNPTRA